MEEGFEPYHVPQQSRRDKLRVGFHNQHSSLPAAACAGLLPVSDPSLIPSDLLTCANNNPQSSNLQIDPATVQIINNNPFLNFPLAQTLRAEPLSLSLSSSHNHCAHQANLNSNPPLELNLQRYDGGSVSIPANDAVLRSSVVPLGPFTGYASVLKGSRFLRPAQQLLEELCDVGGRQICAAEKMSADASLMGPPPLLESLGSGDPPPTLGDGGEGGKKKSRLLTMLDEVYRRYRQYYQQIQAVVTSFEYVSGLGNAAPYVILAINAMTKHFKCLKNVIMDQLQFTNKAHFHNISNKKDESPRFGNVDHRGVGPYGQIRDTQNPELLGNQPIWRPQRGLPERAVTVLRAWLFEHFLHPYPTDTDKLMLARQTGLSRSQVSNWFINARVRLWKPMVEEIHMLETRQSQKNHQNTEDHNKNKPSTSDRFQDDAPFKRTRNYEPTTHDHMSAATNQLPCNAISNVNNNQALGVGTVANSVSLTLGLHQNNGGLALSEPFPMSEALRFGLALEVPSNEDYVISGSESQNRHYGRDQVIGGQLVHDFVG
ncbi:BEL1-like homeodomain protein 9 [Neltuma alba]|uniref:BEL1-like homeodomain protein 9 n=1 Tax=Neltuma alba TaxID=207710 RepID=UPI0010A436A5|nr:BEL1-like homeodomain protein 9 [Prosopis alba]